MTSIPSRSQVYEDRSFDNSGYGEEETSIDGPNFPRRPPRKKSRGNSPSDETPVVYIDLQEMTGNSSTVAGPSSPDRGYEVPREHDFVQNTIFYNPFEDGSKSKASSPVSETSSTTSGIPGPTQRPPPPNRLYLNRNEASASSPSPNLQPTLSIRDLQPQRFPSDDGFTLTPLPVSEFPEPPPAYTEVDRPRHLSTPSVAETVINIQPSANHGFAATNNPAMVNLSVPTNWDRKIMFCPRCGVRVQTLVVKQPGIGTHWIACVLVMLCLLPCVCLVYCLDCCKHKNHYCPNCNHMIGFEGLCHKKISMK